MYNVERQQVVYVMNVVCVVVSMPRYITHNQIGTESWDYNRYYEILYYYQFIVYCGCFPLEDKG